MKTVWNCLENEAANVLRFLWINGISAQRATSEIPAHVGIAVPIAKAGRAARLVSENYGRGRYT